MLTTLLDRIGLHADRTLVSDHAGEYTGRQLLDTAAAIAASVPAPGDGGPERVALLATPGLGYVAGMLGIWMRGAMAVPLCPEHPPAEIAYVLEDADVTAVLVDDALRPLLPPTAVATVSLPAGPGAPGLSPWPSPPADALALMLYTSGTTGRPKGVVHTHATVTAQITCLIEAWAWGPDDRTLHFLPLHHTHGIVNQLLCPLWAGARCDMIPRFDAVTAFELLASTPYTVFMAVPTVYAKAIAAWEGAAVETRTAWSDGCRRLRLMISGSAALAVPILHRWHTISGHVLLERYGMTEIGMALTNPLRGGRRPGFVGTPVPGMEVRLVDEDGVVVGGEEAMGELQVRGDNGFVEYWRRPAETAASFTADGWFRTGDVVALDGGA